MVWANTLWMSIEGTHKPSKGVSSTQKVCSWVWNGKSRDTIALVSNAEPRISDAEAVSGPYLGSFKLKDHII